MVYAQGVGPLGRRASAVLLLARLAERTHSPFATPDSKTLIESIGVTVPDPPVRRPRVPDHPDLAAADALLTKNGLAGPSFRSASA